MESWDEYEKGCLDTFSGGYRDGYRDAFHHGMSTVFTLLRREFPPAEVCKGAAEWKERALKAEAVLEYTSPKATYTI